MALDLHQDTDGQANGADRRRQPRCPFFRQAWAVTLDQPDTRHNVVTQDISVLGVGFVAVSPFAHGSRLVLLIGFDEGQRRKILCRVCWSHEVNPGFYTIGAEFEAAIPDEDSAPAIPREWYEWAQAPRAVVGPVLEAELIPGTFSEPVLV